MGLNCEKILGSWFSLMKFCGLHLKLWTVETELFACSSEKGSSTACHGFTESFTSERASHGLRPCSCGRIRNGRHWWSHMLCRHIWSLTSEVKAPFPVSLVISDVLGKMNKQEATFYLIWLVDSACPRNLHTSINEVTINNKGNNFWMWKNYTFISDDVLSSWCYYRSFFTIFDGFINILLYLDSSISFHTGRLALISRSFTIENIQMINGWMN